MNSTQTVGQRDAAARTYDGTYADLEAILHEWDVVIIDEVDDNPERNPHVGAADLERSGLLDALVAWRDAAVQAALDGLDLKDEYGVLRYTEPHPGPNVMQTEVAAIAVELRAKGVYEPDRSTRPGQLMRRKATDWEEIPHDVTPDDIVPGYSERKAAREVAG